MAEFCPHDPRDGSPRPARPDATDTDLAASLTATHEAFLSWSALSIPARTDMLHRVAAVLEARAEALGRLMAVEMGKPVAQGLAEARKCAWACRHAATHAEAWLAPEPVATEASRSYVRHQPLGPILAIMPWNFPFWQFFRFAASALAAGNTVLLKHAPNVPDCAEAIVDVCRTAGLPEGVVTNVFARVDQVETLLADPRIAAVTLTGSTRAGRAVAALAGKYLKPSVLELGGSDPFLVLSSADLDRAAAVAATARLQNNGQSCIAAKRFIVLADVADAFLQRFRARLAEAVMGDPCDPTTTLGPLARKDLRDTLHAQVMDSIARGARLVLGGVLPEGAGYWYPPTLLTECAPGMPVWDEETFGPVAALRVVRDVEEAVAVANMGTYALGASVWAGDPTEGERVALRLRGGVAFVNELVKSDPRLPFGGVGASGWGRELGREGMRAFTVTRSVWVQ
jgi:succinate-semialdehyde dehydrogenase/glutarate-semialdehyde dehydrogenase